LKKVLQKPDLSGRLVNWAVELGQFDIEFHPRTAIKGQALADFFLEFCNTPEPRDPAPHPLWVVYVDGSSQCQRSGVRVILESPQKQKLEYAIKLDFATTNNEVEYEAVQAGLAIAREVGALDVEIQSDSQVVVGQISGEFATQRDRLAKYLEKVHDLQASFRTMTVTKIPRERNVQADALARAGSATDQEIIKMKRHVLVQPNPSIDKSQCVMQAAREREPEPEWASDIIRYLRSGELPSHKEQAHKVKLQAARYTMVDDMLYRRGYSHPLLKCLSAPEANYVLREIHEGVCGNHSGGRMLAIKAVRAGYYWPTMTWDSMEFVRSCDKCQRFARVMKNPPERLTSVLSPWPFSKWGVDLVGPMPCGKGKKKFLVVAVDYFTKWAEAEALATVTANNVISFLWRSVICRFGIPYSIVSDNGAQFDGKPFRSWCTELGIRNHYSTPMYPKSNGQVEATNKTLLATLKKKLDRRKGLWVEYVPEVLWSYRTTARTPTGETPFSLAYGTEAVIPVEIGSPSHRVQHYDPNQNDEGITACLDLLQERRDNAQAVHEAYRARVARYYNKTVDPRKFKVRDWVLRKLNIMTRDPVEGKFNAKWEGPYRVVKCHSRGAYHLESREGKPVPRAWNAEHLNKYYM
jgi:ribonuclease HI